MFKFTTFGLVLSFGIFVKGGEVKDFKNQHCTDPRTMQKHAAYTEWADAYSCTRHRCQPGGRNLAIYTVGCKRVEAPESAIECEEVVEDTNMQFPFCCTRLRCLVVVRGEVWTRVLGQPWETLPAAPWSHMYKMKRPPPSEFDNKSNSEGPIYELAVEGASTGTLRAKKTDGQEFEDTNLARASGDGRAPDIVIALETNNDRIISEKGHKRGHKSDDRASHRFFEEVPTETDKQPDKERLRYDRADDNEEENTEKPAVDMPKQQTEAPQSNWNPDVDISAEVDNVVKEHPSAEVEEKPSKLQDLVDAIGTRMKDIENVVQRMSQRVQEEDVESGEKRSKRRRTSESVAQKAGERVPPAKEDTAADSSEKRPPHESDRTDGATKENGADKKKLKKKANPEGDNYKRFQSKTKPQKHSRKADLTTEPALFVEDEQNGYYSDAVNSILRRNEPKEPQRPTYMAPIESRRKSHNKLSSSTEDRKEDHREERKEDRKHKKHSQKKKKNKHHKKHHDHEKRRKNSIEVDRYVVSLEDSSGSNVIV